MKLLRIFGSSRALNIMKGRKLFRNISIQSKRLCKRYGKFLCQYDKLCAPTGSIRLKLIHYQLCTANAVNISATAIDDARLKINKLRRRTDFSEFPCLETSE